MPTKHGDLSLLDDPVAKFLLNSSVPGHLAYVWTDGTPRVIPIGFCWDGKELVTATPFNAPKLLALNDGDIVAVTFDTYDPPFKILYIRGIIHLVKYDGIVPEWSLAGKRMMGEEGHKAFMGMVQGMLDAHTIEMVRLSVEPTWVGILDFERRFPSGIEKGLEAMALTR
jgi:hypothetical protein